MVSTSLLLSCVSSRAVVENCRHNNNECLVCYSVNCYKRVCKAERFLVMSKKLRRFPEYTGLKNDSKGQVSAIVPDRKSPVAHWPTTVLACHWSEK